MKVLPQARCLTVAAPLLLGACAFTAGETPAPSPAATLGATPALPSPDGGLVPTVSIASATGWAPGEQPTPAAGLAVTEFAADLDHPRWLHVLPNGDVLVAESNMPRRPDDGHGLRAWAQAQVQKRAGAGMPSADRLTILRDADGDGRAETRAVFLAGLYSPFGMALVGTTLYVANANGIIAYPYMAGALRVAAAGTLLTDLPAGRNHHWTKNLLASPDGHYLYATVGSNSNVGENGLDEETGRAAISSTRAARRAVARSAWRSMHAARCWSPTTSATGCGG
jgi:glucose/arabinose dehydrogenase